MSDDTPTRDEVERLALFYDPKEDRDDIRPCPHGPYVMYEDYTALSARLAEMERERDALVAAAHETAAGVADFVEATCEKALALGREQKTDLVSVASSAAVIGRRIRALTPDDAREALETVRREAWVSGMTNAANIIGRMQVEDRKQWVALDAAQDLIRAAIRGEDNG